MSHQIKYQDPLVDAGGYQNYLPLAHYDFFPGIVWIWDVHNGDISYLSRGIFYAKNTNSTQKLTAPLRQFVNLPESVDVIYSYGG